MPAPSRTSRAAIVRAAAETLEAEGLHGLTMQSVAARVGVRPPSLYKHVDGRDALVRLVAEAAVGDLIALLAAAAPEDSEPRGALHAAAAALRTFGKDRPGAFRLIFSPGPPSTRPGPDVALLAVAPVLRIATELAGPDDALEAARTITAWASGFIAMEIAGAFGLGGDVDRAFDYGTARIADALSRR
ncbi:TetR/AcrR family transcriptional regulator [Actinotalea ferrariae]|nr:TetR/AcrR family transcriptional regulator [Actinotalea ferrariae]